MIVFVHGLRNWGAVEEYVSAVVRALRERGEEVVLLLSGRVDLIQRIDGGERRVALGPGQAVVNPPGVWHTADVHEPGDALFITPGRGTEHEPR